MIESGAQAFVPDGGHSGDHGNDHGDRDAHMENSQSDVGATLGNISGAAKGINNDQSKPLDMDHDWDNDDLLEEDPSDLLPMKKFVNV